jgi:hypothetical protein
MSDRIHTIDIPLRSGGVRVARGGTRCCAVGTLSRPSIVWLPASRGQCARLATAPARPLEPCRLRCLGGIQRNIGPQRNAVAEDCMETRSIDATALHMYQSQGVPVPSKVY